MLRQHLTAYSLHRSSPPQSTAVTPSMISRAKLGDIDAFTVIVEAYYPRCLRFARSVLQNPDDAEDMVQDTFIRVYQALPRYEERQRFESWLFLILGNCCRTANTTFRRYSSGAVDDTAVLERISSPDEPRASVDDEWEVAVRQALADVPAHNREIFLLHYIEEFSYDEIERITGIKQSALKMRVKRASDLLRKRLGGRT